MSRWVKISIVRMPFSPFKKGDELERVIVDQLANRIKHFAKNEYRKGANNSVTLNEYSFYESQRLLAIDISSIQSTAEISYLENIGDVIVLHPMVLVNNALPSASLKSIRLHKLLEKRRFLLPVFNKVPPFDIAVAKEYYGQGFLDLLCGKSASMNISDLHGIDSNYRVEDLISRFEGLRVEDDDLKYAPAITWLGAEPKIERALDYLFCDGNQPRGCGISKLCKDFDLEPDVFEGYIKESTFLEKTNGDKNVRLRIDRESIILELMRGELHAFEKEMSQKNVIHTSHKHVPSLPSEFTEYHLVGKLFKGEDTSALSLMSYIRSQLQSYIEAIGKTVTLVILDGSGERSMYSLADKVFSNVKIVRMIDFFDEPVLFPHDSIEFGEDVLVVVDLVNSGDFLVKVLEVIKRLTGKAAVGVFAIIMNRVLSRNKYFSDGLIRENGVFDFYIKKSLQPIENMGVVPLSRQYWGETGETFRLYWSAIGNVVEVRRELKKSKGELVLAGDKRHQIERLQSMSLVSKGTTFIKSPIITASLKEVVRSFELEGVVFADDEEHVNSLSDIGAMVYLQSNKGYTSLKRIGMYLSSMDSLEEDVAGVADVGSSSDYDYFVVILLCNKRNVSEDSSYLWSSDAEGLSKLVNSGRVDEVVVIYESSLPVYVTGKEEMGKSFVEVSLGQL